MNARLNTYLIAFLTIFLALIFEHHNKVEAAMVRLLLNSDCSDADMIELKWILNNLAKYVIQPRQLRHAENNGNSNNTVPSLLEKIEKHTLDSKNVKNISNMSMVEEETNVTLTSSRELWPLNCRDLCAGYVPRRCTVTNCIGYRRRQRELQLVRDVCFQTITKGNSAIDIAIAQRRLTSGCAVTRTWQCILEC